MSIWTGPSGPHPASGGGICGNCGNTLPANGSFCVYCGVPAVGASSEAPPPPRPIAPPPPPPPPPVLTDLPGWPPASPSVEPPPPPPVLTDVPGWPPSPPLAAMAPPPPPPPPPSVLTDVPGWPPASPLVEPPPPALVLSPPPSSESVEAGPGRLPSPPPIPAVESQARSSFAPPPSLASEPAPDGRSEQRGRSNPGLISPPPVSSGQRWAPSVDPPSSDSASPRRMSSPVPPSIPFVDGVADDEDEEGVDETVLSAQALAKRATWGLDLPDGARVELRGDTVVGRRPRVPQGSPGQVLTLRLDDPKKMVSRSHALLQLDGEQLSVIDLNSANGSRVVSTDGTEIDCVPGQAVVVGDGWTIAFAEYVVAVTRRVPKFA